MKKIPDKVLKHDKERFGCNLCKVDTSTWFFERLDGEVHLWFCTDCSKFLKKNPHDWRCKK